MNEIFARVDILAPFIILSDTGELLKPEHDFRGYFSAMNYIKYLINSCAITFSVWPYLCLFAYFLLFIKIKKEKCIIYVYTLESSFRHSDVISNIKIVDELHLFQEQFVGWFYLMNTPSSLKRFELFKNVYAQFQWQVNDFYVSHMFSGTIGIFHTTTVSDAFFNSNHSLNTLHS